MSVAAKAVFDRVTALLALIVLAPLLVLIALLVRLTSRGPAVFRQVRSGRDGVPFTIWKFRTMTVDAEERLAGLLDRNEGAGPLFKPGRSAGHPAGGDPASHIARRGPSWSTSCGGRCRSSAPGRPCRPRRRSTASGSGDGCTSSRA
ncbi:sugar transferase [Aeromicrobium sp. UC242_57]|uniref:sugar transferase n=1 Tax=Aeromicrobium sp. UC242_57 TaxID=3374624 RepID=UPI0037BB4E71